MFEKKNLILIGIIGLILGFFIMQQFYLHKKISKTIKPENENNLALEVSELIKTNKKLQDEVDELNQQHENLVNAAEDAATANQTLEDNLNKYKIILGLVDVFGEGVEITFDYKVSSTQLIDLINAIKNIGADVIAINDRRLVPNTSISDGFFTPPTTVKIIGDKDLLYESLERPGGILDQIGFGKVEKKDEITISKK